MMVIVFLCLFVSFGAAMVFFTLKGTDIFTKILYLNITTNILSLSVVILSLIEANKYFLDLAIIYFLLSFIATAAYSRFFSSL